MQLKLSVLLTLLLAISTAAWADDVSDNAPLQGTWLSETAELAGRAFPEEIRKSLKLVVKDDKYAVTAGKSVDQGTVKLNAAAMPKEMDITGVEGPNKGKTLLAIYEHDADTLRVLRPQRQEPPHRVRHQGRHATVPRHLQTREEMTAGRGPKVITMARRRRPDATEVARGMMEECLAYDDELRRGGHFLGGEALGSATSAVTLKMKDRKVEATDGPFAETKEVLGGILLLEARDLNHAVALMSKHPGVKIGPFEICPANEKINELIAARNGAVTKKG